MTYFSNQVSSLYKQLYINRQHHLVQLLNAKHFIDNNYADKYSLADFCSVACMSKFHFIRNFKTVYGVTPHQYLISVRIRHARLLLQENRTVEEVCIQTGFESVPAFTTLFKKMTGKTPAHYKSNFK